jgi:hypothetical protein
MAKKTAKTQGATNGAGASEQASPARGQARGNAAVADALRQRSGAMPHADRIQQAFGHHDISAVSVHNDSAAADAMGAAAFAQGEGVTFGSAPDLHTAAHEAAHVVQQRAGVSLGGGVGAVDDVYERNADAVADLVVGGQSAVGLLDSFTNGQAQGKTASASQGVQRAPKKKVSAGAGKRLTWAKEGIEHTKSVLSYGAGNQKEALAASNFNSYFRMSAMRDNECWEIAPSVRALASQNPDAFTAAKAELAKGGNCGEHAQLGFQYLRTAAIGETINRVDVEGLDHAFVIMGDVKAEDDASLVVCDPWPTGPTACLWEDHFAHNPDKTQINIRRTVTGDGSDIKSVIAAGIRLSPKGHAYVNHKLSDEETKTQMDKGTEGDHPWIWQHQNAASRVYDYEAEQAAPAPTQDTSTGTSTGGPTADTTTTTPEPVNPAPTQGTTTAPTTGTATTGTATTGTATTGTATTGTATTGTTAGETGTARSGQAAAGTYGRRSPTAPPSR